MIVGFTGSRNGVTHQQLDKLYAWLRDHDISEGHHGDCIGADVVFHRLCLNEDVPIHIHPPTDPKYRAFCGGYAEIYPEKAYLSRNRDIVRVSDVLLACPSTPNEVWRSGTWSTVRYAREIGRPLVVFPPWL
jgi:hypothetical protein